MARRIARWIGTATAVTVAASAALVPAGSAAADPAPAPGAFTRTTPGAFSGLVPDGTCAVELTARGGAGGSVIAGVASSNGAGAVITARYPVVPGQEFSGVVGGGGQPSGGTSGSAGNGGPNPGQGGAPDGGRGGTVGAGSSHAGAGGGGSTRVSIGGTLLVIAGGGGGSAGGHDSQGGFGGDAGLPTAFDLPAPGSDGLDGVDTVAGATAGGGQGGQASGPGAGGVHSTTSSLNGFPAVGSQGGAGGNDPNFDSGGGGGGGLFGGGGGASTSSNGAGDAAPGGNGGGGGGGGSSVAYANAPGGLPGAGSDLTATPGPRVSAAHDGRGADGLVQLSWIPCEYDLAVTKDVTAVDPATGEVTWTVTVENRGPDPMTRGDVVTLTDALPGPASTEVTSLDLPPGVTCDVAVGEPMTSPVVCARPFDASSYGGHADGVWGLDVGESITITYAQILTEPGVYPNVATVTDRGDQANNEDRATVEVRGPAAGPRTSTGPQGATQSRPADVAAGTFPLDLSTLTLLDGDGLPVDEVVVPGVGTYRIDRGPDPAAWQLTFTPDPDFVGDAPPVGYRISDTMGNHASSTYTPAVIAARPDVSSGPKGVAQSVDPLANDVFGASAPVVPSSLTLLDADGVSVSSVEVPGEGVYTVDLGDPDHPRLVFTPDPEFVGTATPVRYQVLDADGVAVDTTYTPTVPVGRPDETTGPQGVPQSVDPLANDVFGASAPVVPSSLTLLDADGVSVSSVEVPGEGVYTVDLGDPDHPRLVFTPDPEFVGTATPVRYQVLDADGVIVDTTYTPTVTPVALPDETTGPQGVRQVVDPLANDDPDGERGLDPTTLRLVDPATGELVTTVEVPDVGTFTVVDGRIELQPLPGFVGTADPIGYVVDDADGHTVRSTYTPTVIPVTPVAEPDATTGPLNTPQSVDPFGNDRPGDPAVPLDPSSLTLLDPVTGEPVTAVTIAGQGTYTVDLGDPAGPRIVFTPVTGFVGTATPVTYRIADVNGTTTTSTYTPTIVAGPPEVHDDSAQARRGRPVTFDLTRLVPDLDPGTIALLGPDGAEVLELTVPGEGTWVVDPETGRVTFTPEPGFDGDPTPVRYAATKVDGTPVTGELSIHYLDPAGTGGDRQAQAAGASVLPRTGFDLGPAGQLGALLIALGAAVSTGVSWGRRRQLT